jgi:hypothetical protein
LVETASALCFASDDPIPKTGGFSQDWSLPIGPENLKSIPSISQERRDDDFGGSDDIQMGIAFDQQNVISVSGFEQFRMILRT